MAISQVVNGVTLDQWGRPAGAYRMGVQPPDSRFTTGIGNSVDVAGLSAQKLLRDTGNGLPWQQWGYPGSGPNQPVSYSRYGFSADSNGNQYAVGGGPQPVMTAAQQQMRMMPSSTAAAPQVSGLASIYGQQGGLPQQPANPYPIQSSMGWGFQSPQANAFGMQQQATLQHALNGFRAMYGQMNRPAGPVGGYGGYSR